MSENHSEHCCTLPLTCASGDLKWGLIELQGELQVQEARESPTFPVGTLCQSDFVSQFSKAMQKDLH